MKKEIIVKKWNQAFKTMYDDQRRVDIDSYLPKNLNKSKLVLLSDSLCT